jgi:hypothetical protein
MNGAGLCASIAYCSSSSISPLMCHSMFLDSSRKRKGGWLCCKAFGHEGRLLPIVFAQQSHVFICSARLSSEKFLWMSGSVLFRTKPRAQTCYLVACGLQSQEFDTCVRVRSCEMQLPSFVCICVHWMLMQKLTSYDANCDATCVL